MRFSYVDPSGRKVEIPTLEGLAARLELGAVTGDTPLYDAVADRWAPARDHEIVRALLRDSDREGDPLETGGGVEASREAEVLRVVDDFFDAGLDLSLTPEGTGGGHPTPGDEDPPPRGGGEGLSGEFSLEDLRREPHPRTPPAPPLMHDEPVAGAFRRGEIDRNPTRSPPPPVEGGRGWRSVPGEPVDPPASHDGEAPGTAYWTSGPAPAATPPRTPPPSPSHRRSSSPPSRQGWAGRAAVALLAVAIAWFVFGRGPAADPGPEALSPDLEEILDRISGPAFEGMLSDMTSLVGTGDLPPGPGPRWLEGDYLAQASLFAAEREYWEGIRSLVETLQSRETDLYVGRLRTGISGMGISGADAERVVQEGTRRFAFARAERQEVYDRAQGVAVSAIELHDLLVEHEAEILYEPFTLSGVSRDPILEAVPSNPPIAASMWALIDRVTRGLQDMDILMGVSTQRFVEGLLRSLREAGAGNI